MTKQEILAMTGLTEDQFYAQYPTEASFKKAMGGMVDEYKKGGWIQKATASIKRRGTEGVCTGSKFGGPTCRPGTRRYALAKTFRKMAKARKKEDGGMVDMYEDGGKLPEGILRARLEAHMSPAEASNYLANYGHGGVVDVYQLMGMPTPRMYGMGGYAPIGTYSGIFSPKNHSNMGYAMGGGVNGPNLLPVDTGNMPIFAMGGYPEMTEGELEKGETLYRQKYGNEWEPVTKYDSGGMGRHAQDGSPKPEQNVPLPVGGNIAPRGARKKLDGFDNSGDNLAKEAYLGKDHNGVRFPGRIEIAKMKKEAAEEQAATTAYNKFAKKYGGTIHRMYAKGGATVNPFLQNITRNLQPNPFLERLMQNASTSSTLAPADRPYNSNVNMGAGLNTAVANYMGNNQFYQTGPNYTPNPGTTGSRSVRDMMSGLQPSPFLQRVTQGVPPSPFFQRTSNRPSAQPSSTATSAGTYTAPRPAYTPPANTATARPIGARPAASARPTRPTFEAMTPMAMRGIDLNQLNPANPSSAYADNFDMGNVGENERMYEPYGSSFELTGDELWGSPGSTTIPGTSGELTGDQLFGGSDARNRGTGTNRQGAGMGSNQMDNYLMAAQFLPAAYNLGRGIFEKPWKPGSYETPANIKWEDITDEAGRRDFERARAGMEYATRNIGGSNALAALTGGANEYYRNLGKFNENLANRNRMGRLEASKLNKAIEQSNMQMRMNRDYLAQQAKEKKAEMIGAGISNVGSGAGQLWQNNQMMGALRMAYPNNTTQYTPNQYGSNQSTGTTTSGGFGLDYSRPTFRQYQSWKNR